MVAEIVLVLALHATEHPKALNPYTARNYVHKLATARYGPSGWAYIDELVRRESRWNPRSKSTRSSAFGLFQMLRMPETLTVSQQWERFTRYLDHRYDGSPRLALEHHDERGWY